MRQRHLSFILAIIFLSGIIFYSVDVSALKEETPVLKNISVKDEDKSIQILIQGSAPLTYKILKTSDPPMIIVELEGAETGTVNKKMIIGKDPILDISTDKQDEPFKMVKIEIGLSTSVDVIPVLKDNVLVLDIPKKSAEIPLEITKEEFKKLMDTAKTHQEDKLTLVIEDSSKPSSEASVEVTKEEPKKQEESTKPTSEEPVEVGRKEPPKKDIEKETPPVTAKEKEKENATAVTGIKVDKEKGLSVIISGDGEMRYETFILKDDRLVIDISDTVNKTKKVIYKVGDPPLNSVRIGQHMNPKKKVRVVLDLEKPFSYEINKVDNQLIVYLKTEPLSEPKTESPKSPSEVPVEVAKKEPQKPAEDPKDIEKETPPVSVKEEEKKNATAVTGIKVDKEKGLSVIISGDGEMRYKAFILTLNRLVIDIHDTINKVRPVVYNVGDPVLSSIRVGQHIKPEKKVRVVLDLTGTFPYEITKTKNQIIVKIKNSTISKPKAYAPQPPAETTVEAKKEEMQNPVEITPTPPAKETVKETVEVKKEEVMKEEMMKEEVMKPVEITQSPHAEATLETKKEEIQKTVETTQAPPAETPVELKKEEIQKPVEVTSSSPAEVPIEAKKEEVQKPIEITPAPPTEPPLEVKKEEIQKQVETTPAPPAENPLVEKKEEVKKPMAIPKEEKEQKKQPMEVSPLDKKEEKPAPSIKKDVPLTEKSPTPKPPEIPLSEKNKGKKVSFDFRDMDIISLLYLFESVSGMNFIVSPEVKGKVTVKMREVPWEQALDIILKTHSLGKVVEDNVIRVVPLGTLTKERDEIAKAREAETKAEDLVSKIVPLGYSKPGPMKEAIEKAKVLSPRGNVSVDERTNTLILKDIPKNLVEAEALINVLDKPTPQVSIEAKIIEASTSFTRELGIQWGFKNVQSSAYGNPLPYTFPHSMTVGGSTLTGGTGMSGNSWAVNLPAAVGSGAGGALGLTMGNITNSFTLDLQISALEETGQGKILSNPKITTLDNEKAVIKQGEKIPYATTSAEGTKTEFVDAVLSLTVTPTITPGGAISMKIEITKNEADFSKMSGGVPTISTKEANTSVLVKDGETIVIGGIMKTTKSDSIAGIPLLHKIPILGWLFKKDETKEETSELLIFITPRIVKPS